MSLFGKFIKKPTEKNPAAPDKPGNPAEDSQILGLNAQESQGLQMQDAQSLEFCKSLLEHTSAVLEKIAPLKKQTNAICDASSLAFQKILTQEINRCQDLAAQSASPCLILLRKIKTDLRDLLEDGFYSSMCCDCTKYEGLCEEYAMMRKKLDTLNPEQINAYLSWQELIFKLRKLAETFNKKNLLDLEVSVEKCKGLAKDSLFSEQTIAIKQLIAVIKKQNCRHKGFKTIFSPRLVKKDSIDSNLEKSLFNRFIKLTAPLETVLAPNGSEINSSPG